MFYQRELVGDCYELLNSEVPGEVQNSGGTRSSTSNNSMNNVDPQKVNTEQGNARWSSTKHLLTPVDRECAFLRSPSHMGHHTAVVILNWNGQQWLERFLPNVVAATGADADVISGGHKPTDGSVAWIQSQFTNVKVVRNDTNLGWRWLAIFRSTWTPSSCPAEQRCGGDARLGADRQPYLAGTSQAACHSPRCWSCQRDRFEHAGAAGGFIDRNVQYPSPRPSASPSWTTVSTTTS